VSRRPGRLGTRLPLMALGLAALLGALWGGLLRLGWELPALPSPVAAFHGPLMVAGFLGTVIGMERAVALGRAWAYAAPLASGLGAVALIAGRPPDAGPILTTLGSAGLVLVFAAVLRRQLALFTVVMALGAAIWLTGQVLWLLGRPIHQVTLWWAGFLVLTIAGERLELSRLVRVSPGSHALFVAAAGVLLLGLAVSAAAFEAGARVFGVGLVALTLWLARQDVARYGRGMQAADVHKWLLARAAGKKVAPPRAKKLVK